MAASQLKSKQKPVTDYRIGLVTPKTQRVVITYVVMTCYVETKDGIAALVAHSSCDMKE